jgi:hypothetical protein
MEREKSWKTNIEKRKRVVKILLFEEELDNKIFLGARSRWLGFHYKLINEVDE